MNVLEKKYGKTDREILAVLTFSHLAQHFYAGLSILYPDIMSDLKINYTQLGIMTGANSIVSGFLQMMWSLLSRYRSRRVLLGIGNILMSLGCSVMGIANRFIELVGGNVLSGSGQAAQHPVGTSIITERFDKEKVSRALSIHYGLGYIGNIFSPVILSSIAILMSWRQSIYVLSTVPLIAGLTVLYFLRGEDSASRSIQGEDKGSLLNDIKSTIKIRGAATIIAAQAFAVGGTGMGVIITYTPLFLKNSLKVGDFETSLVYSLAVTGGVIGTILFGYLAERFSVLKMAATAVGMCSFLILLLTLHNSFNILLIPQLFLIGVTSFAIPSLMQSHLASISTKHQRDLLIGLYFTIGFGVSSIWSTLTGLLIDTFNSFGPAWILRASLGAIAFCLIALESWKRTR